MTIIMHICQLNFLLPLVSHQTEIFHSNHIKENMVKSQTNLSNENLYKFRNTVLDVFNFLEWPYTREENKYSFQTEIVCLFSIWTYDHFLLFHIINIVIIDIKS